MAAPTLMLAEIPVAGRIMTTIRTDKIMIPFTLPIFPSLFIIRKKAVN
jgi:hypothetical protein